MGKQETKIRKIVHRLMQCATAGCRNVPGSGDILCTACLTRLAERLRQTERSKEIELDRHKVISSRSGRGAGG